MAHPANDENAQPAGVAGPNDSDRARFGFQKQRLSRAVSQQRLRRKSESETSQLSTPVPPLPFRGCEPEEERPVVSPGDLGTGEDTPMPSAIEIVSLLQRALGDPDEALPLLKAKPSAHKFDFKGRINELTEQNRQLRAALASKREGHRALAETLGHIQSEINFKLKSVKGEVKTARAQIDDRSKIAEMLQDAVRAVWREEALGDQPLWTPTRTASTPQGGEWQNPELQEQVAALKQCCASEAARATLAEALAREREQELAALKVELEEQKGSCAAARHKASKATQLVKEAGDILIRSEEELKRQHKEAMALASTRERGLEEQLAKAKARAQQLEAKLRAAAAKGSARPAAGAPASSASMRGGA